VKRENFAGPTVTLTDQFGSASTPAQRPERLCAPANKNDEDPAAPADPAHLVGYTIRRPFAKVVRQRIVNQFGETFVDVSRPDALMVPTAKSFEGAPPPLGSMFPPGSFQCYKLRRSPETPPFVRVPGVRVEDQFGAITLDVIKPKLLCAPVDRDGDDPAAPTRPDHLLCYKVLHRSRFPRFLLFIGTDLGPSSVEIIRRVEFCVPSFKNP
jgi:hypothetical protein